MFQDCPKISIIKYQNEYPQCIGAQEFRKHEEDEKSQDEQEIGSFHPLLPPKRPWGLNNMMTMRMKKLTTCFMVWGKSMSKPTP